jgi:hypothetical protein
VDFGVTRLLRPKQPIAASISLQTRRNVAKEQRLGIPKPGKSARGFDFRPEERLFGLKETGQGAVRPQKFHDKSA